MVRSYRPASALYEVYSGLGYVKPGSKHEQAAGGGRRTHLASSLKKQRRADLSELEASLVYLLSARRQICLSWRLAWFTY